MSPAPGSIHDPELPLTGRRDTAPPSPDQSSWGSFAGVCAALPSSVDVSYSSSLEISSEVETRDPREGSDSEEEEGSEGLGGYLSH